MSKVTKKQLLKRLEALEEWSNWADNMLGELNHALPDPEYDAKCEEEAADVGASLARHHKRLGLTKPQLKKLDQSIFNELDEKWRFAAVDEDGHVGVFDCEPAINCDEWYEGHGQQKGFLDNNYDTSNWQNSLIERDTAKELLEVDLSSELTGSDYFYSNITSALLDSGSKLVVCFVSDVSETNALSNKRIEVIASLDTSFNDSDGYGWQYAIPINNQGEPLTASEVGL